MHALPTDALRIVHLSDAHLLADHGLHQGVVDTAEALDLVLAEAARVEGVRLLVGSGDLSDDGSRASYRHLLARTDAWARRAGAEVVLVPGNHDRREGFAEVLGGDPTRPLDLVREVDGWRVIGLDTSVPGAGYGDLRPEQLAWLRDELATPAARGTVLVLHHPPLAAPTTLHEALALRDPEALAAVIEASDVRVVLAGHYHHSIVGHLAGVPVVVAPGVANDTDVLAPVGTERAVRGSGFVVVEVSADGDVRSTVVRVHDPRDGDEVFVLDEAAVDRIAAQAGQAGQAGPAPRGRA